MAFKAEYSGLQDGATKAEQGGESIASDAQVMFSRLGQMEQSLVGQAGAAFQRTQQVIHRQLKVIDRTLDEVASGIKNSSLSFDSEDQDGSKAIDNTVGGDVGSLLNGK